MFTAVVVGDREVIAKLRAMPGAIKSNLMRAVMRLGRDLQRHVQQDKLSGQGLHRRTGTQVAALALGRNLKTSRRLRHWSAVADAEMPILMMGQRHQEALIKTRGAPTVWTLHADFVIYVKETDQRLAPAILLNPLVDA